MDKAFDIPASAMPLLRSKLDRFVELGKAIDKLMNHESKSSFDDLDLLFACIDLAVKQKEKDLLIYKDLLDYDAKREAELEDIIVNLRR